MLVGGSLVGFLGFVDVGLFAGVVLLGSTSLLALVLAPSPYDRALRAGRSLAGSPATTGRPGGVRESLSRLGRDRAFLGLCAAVALAELRGDAGLAGFTLFRMSRLSVLPVTLEQWERVLAHEARPARAPVSPRQGKARGSRSSQRVAAARKRGAT